MSNQIKSSKFVKVKADVLAVKSRSIFVDGVTKAKADVLFISGPGTDIIANIILN